jgi:hypothetical protein
MAAGKSINDMLAGAKSTLAHANDFTSGVNHEADKVVSKPPTPASKHEYSSAPYALVNKVRSAVGSNSASGESLGKELSEKKKMVDTAKKGLPTGM